MDMIDQSLISLLAIWFLLRWHWNLKPSTNINKAKLNQSLKLIVFDSHPLSMVSSVFWNHKRQIQFFSWQKKIPHVKCSGFQRMSFKKNHLCKSQGVSHSECEAETYNLTKGERWVFLNFNRWKVLNYGLVVGMIHLFWKHWKHLKFWVFWNVHC